MDSSIIYRLFFVFLIFISPVKAIEFQGKFLQGHFILGKTNPKAKIFIGKKEVKVSKDGFFVFGIDRDQKYDLTFTKIINGKKSITTKKVLKRKYNIQRIDGLAESKVTPPESVYKRIKKENNAIGEARAINSDLPFFKNQFIMPVKGIISGVYGSQRILNGKPKWPHYGIDIAAKKEQKLNFKRACLFPFLVYIVYVFLNQYSLAILLLLGLYFCIRFKNRNKLGR